MTLLNGFISSFLFGNTQVFCAFAINGAYKEVYTMTTEHVKRYDNMFVVKIPQTGSTPPCTFPITGPFVDLVQQYIDLRPGHATTNRFFLNYHNEKCTTQQIGKSQFSGMARRIADYLKLPEPERYTRYSFSKQRGHKAYNINSDNTNAVARTERTECIELNCKPRELKKSSFSYTRAPACVPTISSSTNTGTLRDHRLS